LEWTADAGSLAAWVQLAQQPSGREAVAEAILTSTEAYRHLLDRYYADDLHRGVDAIGWEGWLSVLQSHRMSPARVAEEMFISEEPGQPRRSAPSRAPAPATASSADGTAPNKQRGKEARPRSVGSRL
jgi:hypothetical protein